MDCALFKLMNGDEIIAEVVKDKDDSYTISQPVQIHRNMSPVNTEIIRCSYWLLFSDKSEIVIDKKHVLVFSEDINKNVVKHYEFFLKHADANIVNDQHVHHEQDRFEDVLERAEREYKKRMISTDIDDRDEPHLKDLLFKNANTTIH